MVRITDGPIGCAIGAGVGAVVGGIIGAVAGEFIMKELVHPQIEGV